jgi:hypothetical protein
LREANDVLKTIKKFQITIPINEIHKQSYDTIVAQWSSMGGKDVEAPRRVRKQRIKTLACFGTKKGFCFSIELSW